MRLIDADAQIEELLKGTIITDDLYGMGIMSGVDYAIKKLNEANIIDAVPVVRCKDCKHYSFDGIYYYCKTFGFYCTNRNHNGFCSHGERK